MLAYRALGRAQALGRRTYAAGPIWRTADIEGWGEKATTTLKKDSFEIVVDEPAALGGKDSGPNPLAFMLSSLIGCSQYTLHGVAKQSKMEVGKVQWKGSGKFDLRGVRGDAGCSPAFEEITVEARVETPHSQEELDRMGEQVEQRCIIAATLKKAVPAFTCTFVKA